MLEFCRMLQRTVLSSLSGAHLNSLYAFNSLICTIVCMLFFTAFYVVLLCAYSINNNAAKYHQNQFTIKKNYIANKKGRNILKQCINCAALRKVIRLDGRRRPDVV